MMMDTDEAQDCFGALCTLVAGEARSYRGLAVVPLLMSGGSPAEYVLLDQAVAAGTLRITECRPEGSIPCLTAVNKGPEPVLILDGEELTGGRQNHVCNATTMVGTGTTVLPVSRSEEGSMSRTSAPAGIIAIHGDHLDRYVGALDCADDRALARMTGVAVFFEGCFVCADILQPPARFHELYHKLLRGYALEALVLTNKREFLAQNHINITPGARGVDADVPIPGCDRPARCDPAACTLQLLGELHHATIRLQPAIGLGEDLRLETESVFGAGLIWDGALVQLSLLPRPAA